MKKTLLVLALLALTIGTLGVSTAFAQGQQPTVRPGMGIMHEYIVAVLADKLNLSVDEVNERLLAGETMYEIALAQGIVEDDLPEFQAEIHIQAFEAAVADGVITQDWAKRMSQRMLARSRNAAGSGTCPIGGVPARDGSGARQGMGSWMRGMRWQQTNP